MHYNIAPFFKYIKSHGWNYCESELYVSYNDWMLLSYELSVSESVSMRPECSDFVSIMISFSV